MATLPGVTIFCTGSPLHSRLMEHAIVSYREQGHPVCAITDTRPQATVDEFIPIPTAPGTASRRFKIQFLRLTPYSEGYFVDADTILLRTLPSVEQFLNDQADLAMAIDKVGSLRYFAEHPHESNWIRPNERELTLKMVGPDGLDHPHWNSGVIAYRRTERSLELCDTWLDEWERFGRVDQFALVRAALRTGHRIATLPVEYNYRTVRQLTGLPKIAIVHYYASGKATRLNRLERMVSHAANAGLPGRFDIGIAWHRVLRRGQLSARQYREVAEEILLRHGRCNLLVFGMGFDTPLWQSLNRDGKTLFVEDDPAWIQRIANERTHILRMHYATKVGVETQIPPIPCELLATKWDVIFIDGPSGAGATHPGRMVPIAWTSHLRPEVTFVHDYDRTWERTCCDRYLGRMPSQLIPHSHGNRRVLCRFDK